MGFEKQLRAQKMLLLQQLEWIKKHRAPALPGILRASKHRDGYQFYIRENQQDRNGRYLAKTELPVAKQMAQQEYLERQEKLILEQLRMIEKFERIGVEDPWVHAEQAMSRGKATLIEKNMLSDAEYTAWWESQEYQRKEFREDSPLFYTEKNERVRSKSEVIIANALYSAGVPYHYERPLRIPRVGTLHPDFTVLRIFDRREILWEHLGMMDDMEYRTSTAQKIRVYENAGYYLGYNLILTFETSRNPINTRNIRDMIEKIFGEEV